MGKYFGTDGFRGETNCGLTVDHAFKIGRYVGNHFSRIAIGKDTRRSCYMFEYALCAGINASGCDAYILHVTPTPSVSYVVKSEKFDCGIMITASHNPFYDNGIKLINANGEKMDEAFIEDLEKYIDSNEVLPLATREHVGVTVDHAAGRNRYIGHLISLATRSYDGIKVGLDCANGTTWMIAKSVFDALGADTYVINNRPNGLNVNVECGSTHPEALAELVKSKGLDIGFAFDGDADRCIAVDNKGNVVNGDAIMYVCAKYMKDRGILGDSKVVTTIMSNMGLYKALDNLGIGYEQTPVGDKYVAECMRNNGHLIGGEQSGHIIFGRFASSGDGMLTAIKIMEVVTESKMSLSELCEGLKVYPQVNKNIRVKDKDVAMKNAAVLAAIASAEKSMGDRGRVVYRPSGTEPVVRLMVEAENSELCSSVLDSILKVFDAEGLYAEN